MTVAKIHGAEFPVRKIFSNDFNFKIPLYQRPYSWTTEQAGELLDDLISFIGSDSSVCIDELSPYFLGSIVLIKDESQPESEVVDGQQRLTTLTILLSALRHTIATPAYASGMTDYLYQEGKPLEGTPNHYRLTLRERDAHFFRTHIQDKGQITTLRGLDAGQLSDSQRNIRANAVEYLDSLAKLPENQRVRLAQFIVKNCLLVAVSTPDLDSAYRIFSILNDRGLDLSHSDILKSEIIGRLPSKEQEAYNEAWEDAEEELGREPFSDLFGHIRMIYRKQKGRESVLKEFREYVVKEVGDSKKLIDKVLIPFADAFATIQTASYESAAGAEQVNEMLTWLGRIDNTDWIPPAIVFMANNKSDPKALQRFFAGLERLAAFLMICRYGINERIERYGKLLDAIANDVDLYATESPLLLSDAECRRFVRELNGNVYEQVPKRRLYILLRLDAALSDGSAIYNHSVISIEHVLPQTPLAGSQWCDWFPTQDDRDHWVHRLGNLLLLNHKKNSSASNYDFNKKKIAYFTKGGVSPFPLTTQAVTETEWTLQVVKRRQMDLVDKLKQVWQVNVAVPADTFDKDEDEEDSTGDSANGQTAEAEKMGGKTPWSGYWFVNVGDGEHRNWDDCVKYGFLSAGQGRIYGEAMKKLKVGDKVFAYMKGHGYVGFGSVTQEAVMAKDFEVDGQCLFDLPLVQSGIKENSDNPDFSEWPVGIKWSRTYPRDQARTFSGAFANPNIVCKLRDERTVKFVTQEFGVEEDYSSEGPQSDHTD